VNDFLRVLMLSLIVLGMLAGCNDSREEELRSWEWQKKKLGEILTDRENDSRWPKDEEVLAPIRAKLKELEASGPGGITDVPEPYAVDFDARTSTTKRLHGDPGLIVCWLERNTDVAAIRIRERWAGGEEIDETYQMCEPHKKVLWSWEGSLWGHVAGWDITRRKDPSQRKDEKAWDAWLKSASPTPQNQPNLYVARPSAEVSVRVSLIDEKGQEGASVPVTLWADPPGQTTQATPTTQEGQRPD